MELIESELISPYGRSITDELLKGSDRVGPFEIVDCLSVTLLGALYRAHMRPAGGAVLVHILPSALCRDPRLAEALREKVKRLQELESDVLLIPRDVVNLGESLAVVYPDWSGRSLTAHQSISPESYPLSSSDLATRLKRVLLAFEVAEQARVHHFALTPDFLLIDEQKRLKVWGFGVMEALDRRGFEIFVSSAIVPIKQGVEVPGYTLIDALSPEWRNRDAVDVRGDLFGLGVLAYNLLTSQRLEAHWVPPSELIEGTPVGWDILISRLLAPYPVDRYQTLSALGPELDHVDRLGLTGADAGVRRGPKVERIPLPEGVTRRASAGVQKGIRFAVLAVVLGMAGFAGWMLYQIATDDASATPASDVYQVAESESPNLRLRIHPDRARVRFFGEGGATYVTTNGFLYLKAIPQTYLVVVEAPGHESVQVSLEVTPQPTEQTIELPLAWGRLRVFAPAGSRVDVLREDGQRTFLDTVPEAGVIEFDERLLAQSYDLVVSEVGYGEEIFRGVELESANWRELRVKLAAKAATLVIRADVDGVPVWVDGQLKGETPLQLDGIDASGPVGVRIGGGPWRVQEQFFQLRPGRENLIDFGPLESARGTLRLQAMAFGVPLAGTALEDLVVHFGAQAFAGTDALSQVLQPGPWRIRVAHPDYFPEELEVSVEDGQDALLPIALRARPARVQVTLPEGVSAFTVMIDGQRLEQSEPWFELSAGEDHEVYLQVTDYLPLGRRFRVDPNTVEEWHPQWRPLPGPEEGEDWKIPYLGLEMRHFRAGMVRMGSPKTESLRRPNEGPLTEVRLSRPFWVGATEVSQESYMSVMNRNPSNFRDPEKPVDSVTWNQAQDFCARVTEREQFAGRLPEGYVYRLPTEAEWEYAARAGTGKPFVEGDEASPNDGNFRGQYPRVYGSAEIRSDHHYGTLPCGRFAPNRGGLFDVHGNVREWTLDAYNDRLAGGQETDFHRPGPGRGFAVRGGGWDDFADRCRLAARDALPASSALPNLGFRIVLAPAL